MEWRKVRPRRPLSDPAANRDALRPDIGLIRIAFRDDGPADGHRAPFGSAAVLQWPMLTAERGIQPCAAQARMLKSSRWAQARTDGVFLSFPGCGTADCGRRAGG